MNFIPKTKPIIEANYPSLIKYMGSKSKIMDFVIKGINEVHEDGSILDLFAGSASLAGAIGQQCTVHSNDIQAYSSILADTYNRAYKTEGTPSAESIINQAADTVRALEQKVPILVSFDKDLDLKTFQSLEDQQKRIIDIEFSAEWHLFTKNYSGTWWSLEQCMWIDAIRGIAEKHRKTGHFSIILSALMYAMAYASQGTGHYAQYRDAKTNSSLRDILIYRRRSVADYFTKKYNDLLNFVPTAPSKLSHKSTQLDFKGCLRNHKGGTVYADPPYCFVHYSRFYHALETLVLYDYPELQIKGDKVVKGRYRDNRHQSPFCIKTKVKKSFEDLFKGVRSSCSNLVLSYSNTGMISIEEVAIIGSKIFPDHKLQLLTTDHMHMTLGRKNDRQREVKECLILLKNR
ncbi:DNA adenine methylase [Thalassospira lucentensis]|uniref:DNA adenine methylase n=1 Tax=Thalassospira lucentensis TaxID=168935 RepID=UPI003D2EE484